jgi:hypothetical protein
VKKRIKIFSVYILAIVYCLAVVLVTQSQVQISRYSKPSLSNEKSFSDISSKLFNHTPLSDKSLNNKYNLPVPTSHNHFGDYWGMIHQIGGLFDTRYKQYLTFSKTILVNLRKINFLFPFHYFW